MFQTTGEIDFRQREQMIDGFGCCLAFQRAAVVRGMFGLTAENQREVLDLLFSPERGAGLSILRLGIGSSPDGSYDNMKSIQPVSPGGPDQPSRYEWDRDDGGQVWLARQAQSYGVDRFFASAWSAPPYMKTNDSDIDGGELRGLPGTDPALGDWRQAYADYLVQYARFYADEGIPITDLGFTNEPDLRPMPYASMQMTPAQTVDMVKVLGPTVQRSGLPITIVCSDAMDWQNQADYTAAIESDPEARRWVGVHAGHTYNPAHHPLPTDRPVWMSEWDPDVAAKVTDKQWNEAWDNNVPSSGMRFAEHLHDALTRLRVNGYFGWLGASIGPTCAPIQLDGPDYHVSKRLWALAAYSRFIRPGAARFSATASDPVVKVSAFRNQDATTVVAIINSAEGEGRVDLTAEGLPGQSRATAYLTDEKRSLEPLDLASIYDRCLSVDLPPRSLVTVSLG